MNRSFRLTPQAEDSLVDIAIWTIDNFGLKQADQYEMELIERCEAVARGDAMSRNCASLVDGAFDLRFARAGEHFLIFLDDPEEIVILDILHGRSDLPRHVAALMNMKTQT